MNICRNGRRRPFACTLFTVGGIILLSVVIIPSGVESLQDSFCPKRIELYDQTGPVMMSYLDKLSEGPHLTTAEEHRPDWSAMCAYEEQHTTDRVIFSVQWLDGEYSLYSAEGGLVQFPNFGCSAFTGQPDDRVLSRTHEASVNWGEFFPETREYSGIEKVAQTLLEKAEANAANCDMTTLPFCPSVINDQVRYTQIGPRWESKQRGWIQHTCVYGPDDWANVDLWSEGRKTDLTWMMVGWAEKKSPELHWGCSATPPPGPEYEDPSVKYTVLGGHHSTQSGIVLMKSSSVQGLRVEPQNLKDSMDIANYSLGELSSQAALCASKNTFGATEIKVGVVIAIAATGGIVGVVRFLRARP